MTAIAPKELSTSQRTSLPEEVALQDIQQSLLTRGMAGNLAVRDTLSHSTTEQAELATQYDAVLANPVVYPSAFGGEVRITRAAAIEHETGKPADTIPVYFSGGYGNVKNAPFLVNLAQHGRNAFSVGYLGDRKSATTFSVITPTADGKEAVTHRMKDARKLIGNGSEGRSVVATHQMQKAASLVSAMEKEGIGQTDAIFQSEGALHGMIAAYTRPELFRKVVFAYPAGIGGQDKPGDVSRKVAKDMRAKLRSRVSSEQSFKNDLGEDSVALAGIHKQGRAPGAMVDGATVAFSDHGELLHEMREEPNAPGVALVAGLDDIIYPPERFLRSLRSSEDIDFLLVTEGYHGVSYRRDVMDQITALFPAMENRKATREKAMQAGTELPFEPLRNRIILPANISSARAEQLYVLADELDARSKKAG